MDLRKLFQKYADEISGQYVEYDPEHSIIIVPVSGGRAQTVLGEIRKNELYNRQLICFVSKICPAQQDLDYRSILSQTAFLNYSRFVIRESYLQLEAVAALDSASEDAVKEMIQEVANVADQFELKLTGADVQ